ncbi:hypothetical protein CWC11_09445 [Pseudoalteromonas sp. S3178]|uniref:hypothetical protein n=1 Tax=Pseudoalteromonas sp. S3178 TaxID=579532 RepID=UPI00110A2856|nr:hypothetical protein [Pseudoalteromonas sp. S3178]TMP05817.1 hypothetical protein CWC11_09445 [Pseudoalteromonas sp. S3178]
MVHIKYSYNLKKLMFFLIASCSILFVCTKAYADNIDNTKVIIVVNTTDKALTFSKQQIRHIYMGGAMSRQFKAINLPAGNPLRIDFNTKMVGLTESRIQAYWAQMKFTGRSKPPVEFSTTKEVIEYLMAVENAVAYLPSGIKIPDELTVVALSP